MNRSVGLWLRAWAIGGWMGLLLLVVAVSATDLPGGQPQARFFSVDSEAVGEVVVPFLRLAYLALLVAAFYQWLNHRQSRGRRRGEGKRVSPLATFAALVLVAGFVIIVLPHVRGRREATGVLTTLGEPTQGTTALGDVAVAPLGDPGWGLWLLVMLGAGALVYLAVSRRMVASTATATDDRPERHQPERHPSSIRSAPADQTDPNGRVFTAYRRVEEASHRSGLSRSSDETVGAHLGRLGTAISEGVTASDLAGTYNRARFSDLRLSADAADAAEAAGRRLEDGLAR